MREKSYYKLKKNRKYLEHDGNFFMIILIGFNYMWNKISVNFTKLYFKR